MIFEWQGTKINYEVMGEGIPFLFIHGWGVDHHIMSGPVEPMFDELKKDPVAGILSEKKYKRIYIDLPGMGKSKASEKIHNSDDVIEVIEAFIDDVIGTEKFLLMGQSYGGYLSRGLSVKRADQMLGMILWCPLIFPGYRAGRPSLPQQVKKEEKDFLEKLSKEERDGFTYLAIIQTEEVYKRYVEDVVPGLSSQDEHFLSEVLDGAFSYDVDAVKEPFQKPILCITGKQDTEVGYKDAYDLLDVYPEISYVVLEGAGHNLPTEKPRMFRSIVAGWLLEQSI